MLPQLKNNFRDKTIVFVSEVSPTLCLHSRESGSTKRSSALFKDSYLRVLFHNDTGIGGAKKS